MLSVAHRYVAWYYTSENILSFLFLLLQDGQENSPRHSKRSSNVVVPLYDQLTSLKDWTEETAELCSAEEGRYAKPRPLFSTIA